MSDMLTCPVCERPGVPAGSKSCPQCDADLTCFQALETLSEKKSSPVAEELAGGAKEEERKSSSSSRRAVLLLLLLLVLIGSGFLFYVLKAQEHVHDLKQRVVFLKTDLLVAEQNVEQAKQMLCVLPESEKMGVVEEDTFEEDDPLIYEEDKVQVKVKNEVNTALSKSSEGSGGEEAVVASAATEGEGLWKEQEGEQGVEDTLAAEPMVETAGLEAGKETGAAASDSVESVPVVVEAVSNKLEIGPFSEDTIAKAVEPPVESSPLLPEERWSERTFLYLIKETDTLWGLAARFYGDGKYYPVIMEQNPGLVISNIHDEEILRLFNERTVLEDIYKRRIEWRDGLVLWKHKVGHGETRQGIEDRFASPGSSGRVFYEKTPDIQSGATVRIILH
ncbi:hypothetical protein VU12_10425 [Desulfobulbus sp. US4]|nr:hypothetical protein [Desulfobulbus sp. US4]